MTWLPALSLVKRLPENERLERPARALRGPGPRLRLQLLCTMGGTLHNIWVSLWHRKRRGACPQGSVASQGVVKNVTHLKPLSGFLAEGCGAGHAIYLSEPRVLRHKVGIARTTSQSWCED